MGIQLRCVLRQKLLRPLCHLCPVALLETHGQDAHIHILQHSLTTCLLDKVVRESRPLHHVFQNMGLELHCEFDEMQQTAGARANRARHFTMTVAARALHASLAVAGGAMFRDVSPLSVPLFPPRGVAMPLTTTTLDSSLAMASAALHLSVAAASEALLHVGRVRDLDIYYLVLEHLIKSNINAPRRRRGAKHWPIHWGASVWFVGPFGGAIFREGF